MRKDSGRGTERQKDRKKERGGAICEEYEERRAIVYSMLYKRRKMDEMVNQ